jgi:hypothetical protein
MADSILKGKAAIVTEKPHAQHQPHTTDKVMESTPLQETAHDSLLDR